MPYLGHLPFLKELDESDLATLYDAAVVDKNAEHLAEGHLLPTVRPQLKLAQGDYLG